jgi:D-serine deaminase-like pyridoxal phosphate-dependent protein
MSDRWYELENCTEVDSPALLVYPDRIAENIRRMVSIAGSPQRLRPHIKTHKMSAVMRMQLAAGIDKCKCATLAEAEMAARAGATDIMLAHQPVGPKVGKLATLAKRFSQVRFSALVDDPRIARKLSDACVEAACRIELLVDLEIGMGRSGIVFGPSAVELYRLIARLPNVSPGGIHAYDGHIREPDVARRQSACDQEMRSALEFREQLLAEGLPVPRLVAGGTPTFPIHARHADRECSPGTCVLHDAGYGRQFPDLGFLPAAVVLSRVISKPGKNRLCLDLGHKAVAVDRVNVPHVVWFDLPDVQIIVHSEEHLVLETPAADRHQVGDVLFGIPEHICPTCALHKQAVVVREGRATETWPIDARDRV